MRKNYTLTQGWIWNLISPALPIQLLLLKDINGHDCAAVHPFAWYGFPIWGNDNVIKTLARLVCINESGDLATKSAFRFQGVIHFQIEWVAWFLQNGQYQKNQSPAFPIRFSYRGWFWLWFPDARPGDAVDFRVVGSRSFSGWSDLVSPELTWCLWPFAQSPWQTSLNEPSDQQEHVGRRC